MQEPIWEIVTPADLTFNPFTLIGKEWMLVTAGNETAHNTLTASWGGLGVLWKKDVSYIFILSGIPCNFWSKRTIIPSASSTKHITPHWHIAAPTLAKMWTRTKKPA